MKKKTVKLPRDHLVITVFRQSSGQWTSWLSDPYLTPHLTPDRLVACVSGEQGHLAETLATLRFAVRLRGVVCAPRQEVADDPTLLLSKLKVSPSLVCLSVWL